MRVGTVVRVVTDRHFGFIHSDEFRDDIFFHFSIVEKTDDPEKWLEGQMVEYELDELARIDRKELKAIRVQAAKRPLQVTLPEFDPLSKPKHHPKARQRKPGWREKREGRSE